MLNLVAQYEIYVRLQIDSYMIDIWRMYRERFCLLTSVIVARGGNFFVSDSKVNTLDCFCVRSFTTIAQFFSVATFQIIPLLRRLRGSRTANERLGLPYLITLLCYFSIFTILVDKELFNISDHACKVVAAILYTCLISVVLWSLVHGLTIIKRLFVFTKVLDIATHTYINCGICTGMPQKSFFNNTHYRCD